MTDHEDHNPSDIDKRENSLRADLEGRVEAIHSRWEEERELLADLCESVRQDALNLGDHVIAIDMHRRLASIAEDDRAAELLEAALELATDSPYAAALVHRDLAWRSRRDVDSHIAHLLTAADAFQTADEPRLAAFALLDAGEAVGGAGNRSRAVEIFERAQYLARSAGDGLLSARADDRLAAAHWELGRSDLAEWHLREALQIVDASGDQPLIANAQFRLGWFLADHDPDDAADEALRLLGKARAHAQENGDLGRVAACDEKASWVKAASGDYDAAISLSRSAVAVFTAIGDEYAAMVAECNLAGQLISVDRVDEGMSRYRDIIQRAKSTGDNYLHATVSTRLADELAKHDAGAEALSILEAAAPYFDNNDNAVEATSHILATAAAHRALRNVRATHEYAEKALDRLDRAVLPSKHARALEYIAECVLYDGDRLRAESLFGQAVALYLIDDQPDHARRVAQHILPGPPRQRDTSRPATPQLTTGVYL